MKHLIKFLFIALVPISMLLSCGDNGGGEKPDDGKKVTLSADRTSIMADGYEEVILTVKYGSEDVTSSAKIKVNGEDFTGSKFTSTEIGRYRFVAEYNGKTSAQVLVLVTEAITPEPLVLTVDKSVIEANGEDRAQFTVTQGGVDITDRISVCIAGEGGLCLTFPVFRTEAADEYEFYAYITADVEKPNRLLSNNVSVTAEPVSVFDMAKTLHKNVLYFVTAGTWCGPCYVLKNSMKNIENDHGDNMVTVNLYDGTSNSAVSTPLESTYTGQVNGDGRFIVGNEFPVVVAEFRSRLGVIGKIATEDEVRDAYDEFIVNPAKTGLKVNSTIENGKINVSVTVGAKEAGTYYIGVLLVEDDVVCRQNTSAYEYIDNYEHLDVLRAKATDSFFGEELGVIAAGDTKSKNYSFTLETKYNPENLSLVIYTLVEEGGHKVIVNSVKAPVNRPTGFAYDN